MFYTVERLRKRLDELEAAGVIANDTIVMLPWNGWATAVEEVSPSPPVENVDQQPPPFLWVAPKGVV